MGYRNRRRLDVFLLLAAAAALAGSLVVATRIADSERITGYWARATIGEQQVEITEVIDYDFGRVGRRGIFRDVPGLDPSARIEVSSPTAPTDVVVERIRGVTRLRIGDPDTTIGGRHRYTITYPLARSELVTPDGRFAWDGVGTDWPVSIANISIEVVGATRFDQPACSSGPFGSTRGCDVDQPEPGLLTAGGGRLFPREGITVSADLGPAVTPPTPPDPPTGPGRDVGLSAFLLAGLGAATAFAASLIASGRIRRAGREQVWVGGAADAAFGTGHGQPKPTDPPPAAPAGIRLVDHEELAEMAAVEFVPPRGLTAWQGGVLHREGRSDEHRVAWLLERAIDGELTLTQNDEGDVVELVRSSIDHEPSRGVHALFGPRQSVSLTSYDSQFAAGWNSIGAELDSWQASSGLWDPAGDARRARAVGWGLVQAFLGWVVAVAGAALSARWGLPWPVLVVAGALPAGWGAAKVIRSWELRVRTPEGSGLWILVESFRRFIERSEARHVADAARQGRLLEYTAWATALGHADHWAEAVSVAVTADPELGHAAGARAVAFSTLAPSLSSATATAATAPSSSGGGGGGGGFSGGGGGGGGGGSW